MNLLTWIGPGILSFGSSPFRVVVRWGGTGGAAFLRPRDPDIIPIDEPSNNPDPSNSGGGGGGNIAVVGEKTSENRFPGTIQPWIGRELVQEGHCSWTAAGGYWGCWLGTRREITSWVVKELPCSRLGTSSVLGTAMDIDENQNGSTNGHQWCSYGRLVNLIGWMIEAMAE